MNISLPSGKVLAMQQNAEVAVGSTLQVAVSGDSLRPATCRYVGGKRLYLCIRQLMGRCCSAAPSTDRLGEVF